VAVVLGCDGSSPTAPSESRESTATPVDAVSGPGDVATIASAPDGSTLKANAPTAQSPINDETIDESLMPTLVADNAAGTFVTGAFEYRFEVHTRNGTSEAKDAGTGVPGGDGTTTTYPVTTALEEDTAYQWRARAEMAGHHGPWSAWAYFSTPILSSIDKPIQNQPANGSTGTSLRPVLEVINSNTSGNVGTVMYEFQIARDSAFTDIVETMTQTSGQHAALASVFGSHEPSQKTSVQPTADLEYETTYYWRARGTDEAASTVSAAAGRPGAVSEYSGAWAFTTAAEASSGGGGGDALNLSTATFLHANISGWPVTSTVTSVSIGNPPICIKHTKAGGWPVIQVSGTNVEGNAWVAFQIGGTWYAATWEYLRPGQTCKQLSGSDLGPHIKKPPGSSWSPKSGETVYFFVSTPARGAERSTNERSNVFRTTWP
jgi:hypothetical protein